MEKLYEVDFARAKSAGRPIYDELMSGTPHALCPLCKIRTATQLDHFLPKTKYPLLAVTPLNLVPCCAECNKTMGASAPISVETQMLHPYFDSIGTHRWLWAEVHPSSPALITFTVRPADVWDEAFAARVIHYFKLLKLDNLYSKFAGTIMGDIRYRLTQLSTSDLRREYLVEEYETRARRDLNSPQAASYLAMSKSSWFCEEGFELSRDIVAPAA